MTEFILFHPFTQFLYFSAVIGITIFTQNPVLHIISLAGAVFLHIRLAGGRKTLKSVSILIPVALAVAVINPLISHNGATPILFINGNAVTAEAFFFGCDISVMLCAAIFWFFCVSRVMTSERVTFLFGRMLSRISLLISMTMRFIPSLVSQSKEISDAQKLMGLYAGENLLSKMKSNMRTVSALIGRSLENAVESSDSMRARGYGLRGRTCYSPFRFRVRDGVFTILTVLLMSVAITAEIPALSGGTVLYYPQTALLPLNAVTAAAYTCFMVLSVIAAKKINNSCFIGAK